jgi:cell division protein FtsN
MGSGPGPVQWLALGGAVLVMLCLTFALGLLVGRQWARQSASALIATAEPTRKPAASPRRSGIAAETMADRVPEPTEKLTFYQTLTEPLDGPGAAPKPEAKPVAVKLPPPATLPPTPSAPAAAKAPAPTLPASPQSSWTIQVGAYKNRRQAEESRQKLAGAGLDAYVVTLAAQEGVARYRVRVGTYRSREEAASAAERLRAQRSLTTFVTPK